MRERRVHAAREADMIADDPPRMQRKFLRLLAALDEKSVRFVSFYLCISFILMLLDVSADAELGGAVSFGRAATTTYLLAVCAVHLPVLVFRMPGWAMIGAHLLLVCHWGFWALVVQTAPWYTPMAAAGVWLFFILVALSLVSQVVLPERAR